MIILRKRVKASSLVVWNVRCVGGMHRIKQRALNGLSIQLSDRQQW